MRDPAAQLRTETCEPTSVLRPFVRRLLNTYSLGPTRYNVALPATGAMYITCICGAPMSARLGDEEPVTLPRLFVGGQLRSVIPVLDVDGPVDIVGAEFTPTGFYRLFGIDCSALTDRFTPWDVVCSAGAADLELVLLQVDGPQDRRERLHRFLLERVPEAREAPHVEQAVELIERCQGEVSVAELVDATSLGVRQLQRQFLRCVGVGPKHFTKLVQIRRVIQALYAEDAVELRTLAQDAGYYDQAHFVRDFRRLIGPNPVNFLRCSDSFLRVYLAHQRSPE